VIRALWALAVVAWYDAVDAARAWWRRHAIRCREPHCTEERRLNCPTLKGTKP
jgi:hypothetical protein